MEPTLIVDDMSVITLLTQQNELLQAIYILLLFVLGVSCGIFVVYIFYRFLRLCI